MKMLIFGTGKKYADLKEYIDYGNVIAFLDSNPEKEGMIFEGKKIYHPSRLPDEIRFDAVIIMSMYYVEMKKQLMDSGISEDKIYSFFQLGELQVSNISEQEKDIVETWRGSERRFLLIQHDGGGGGASIALTALAVALSKFYSVLVTFPDKGETISIYKRNSIPYICNIQMNCDTEMFRTILSSAEIILVNAIINNNVIALLHRRKRSFYLWLHDHYTTYERSDCRLLKECIDDNTKLLAVSNMAMKLFSDYIKNMPYTLFPLAVRRDSSVNKEKEGTGLPVIAVIGDIYDIKGQDILLTALETVEYDCKLKLIGGVAKRSEFSDKILAVCAGKKTYKYIGKLTNEEIHRLYQKGEINILICPSRFETMSIASIEAMSYGVPVIVSDMTGVADYIRETEPNCIFRSEDTEMLAERINWLLSTPGKMQEVGGKMKQIYEKYFSMEQLEKRCEIFYE